MGSKGSKQANEGSKPDESCFFSYESQKQQREINLTDATPCNLQTVFGLQSLPETIIDEKGKCIFPKDGSTWKSKLEKNRHYKIVFHQHAAEAGNPPTANQKQTPSALNSMDIHCAIICSKAAQLCGFKEKNSKSDEIRTVFKELSKDKHFDDICPSIYGEVQYILARSANVLYITFGGDDFSSMMARPTKVDMEFLKEGEEEYIRPIKGDCNEYIWKQSKSISVELILGKLKIFDIGIKRVVVCGRGVGGAIANVFALRLQLRLNLLKAKDKKYSLPELVCITFGAPRCLSKVIAEEVGHLDNFFNIINIKDPVPTVLDQAAGVANSPGYIKDKSRKEIEVRFQDLLRRMTMVFSEEERSVSEERPDDYEYGPLALYQEDNTHYQNLDMTQKIEELKTFCRMNKITFEDVIKCPFYPIGWYIFCCHDEEDVESDYDAPFNMPDVIKGKSIQRFDNRRVCFIKNADLATKLLAKPIIQESAVSQHLNYSYFKMVSQSISKNYRSSLPAEHNEQEPEMAQSSRPSCDITNLFPPRADKIQLTKRTLVCWKRRFVLKKRLVIVVKGKNLGFFTLCDSNFNRLPLAKDSQLVIRHESDERIELEGDFDANKCILDRPGVDVATHFGIIKIQTDGDEIKEIEAKTLTNTFVDGLSPLLLLRAWQRGISSVILTESASRESEVVNNKLLSQLYKLEKNSLKRDSVRESHLLDYSKKAAEKGFHVLGEPDQELLEILVGIIESLSDELIIEYSIVGRALLHMFGNFIAFNLNSILWRLVDHKNAATVISAVTNPSKHTFTILSNEAYKWLCKSIGKRFTHIEDDYSSMLCTYIRTLRDVNDLRQVFEDTMATIYELEETLYKKCEALGYIGKDPEAILNENPFKEGHSFTMALESSKYNVLRRIQLSCYMFELRQRLKEDCYIGIVGPQDAGKSTLIKQVWGLDVGVIGYTEHTREAHVFKIPGADKLKVADFPGSTSIDDYMANVIQTCGGMASFLILVMPYVGDVSRTHLKEFENTEGFQLPTLVCISKCAMVFKHSEDFRSKESVDLARRRYAKALKVDAEDVFFTEFLECSPEMKAKGIAGTTEVKKWMKTKLTQLDFYMENDDELNHALNR